MSFQRFHDTWFEQLRHLVHQLSQAPRPPTTEEDYHHLHQLVNKVMSHCAEYYRVKSLAIKQDVLSFSTAQWTTTLERSLHWIGGWRPTTVFHLVYTESSILFESRVVDILRGFRTGDLGDLSPGQFRRVSELQCETVHEENAITDELSEWQDSASDLVGLCGDFDEKMERLARILNKADSLRLKTIETVVELLTPQQAAEFLVAAAELHFGIHAWGVEQDRQRGNA
ncbi:transcription factor TGA5 [Olea europaea subsp. europaea]|uniref:Transcription factor TGA5 n=1 Tax=Olea europaea subsp. europaea TaxID=158383 RepID=A0A8S0TL93_OLEEU|nr:transcription factor TGA5 [Olea europaea subsp. europaea]